MDRDKLHNSQIHNALLESWLRSEVATAYDAHRANPRKARSLDDAWQRFEARMDEIDREGV